MTQYCSQTKGTLRRQTFNWLTRFLRSWELNSGRQHTRKITEPHLTWSILLLWRMFTMKSHHFKEAPCYTGFGSSLCWQLIRLTLLTNMPSPVRSRSSKVGIFTLKNSMLASVQFLRFWKMYVLGTVPLTGARGKWHTVWAGLFPSLKTELVWYVYLQSVQRQRRNSTWKTCILQTSECPWGSARKRQSGLECWGSIEPWEESRERETVWLTGPCLEEKHFLMKLLTLVDWSSHLSPFASATPQAQERVHIPYWDIVDRSSRNTDTGKNEKDPSGYLWVRSCML